MWCGEETDGLQQSHSRSRIKKEQQEGQRNDERMKSRNTKEIGERLLRIGKHGRKMERPTSCSGLRIGTEEKSI